MTSLSRRRVAGALAAVGLVAALVVPATSIGSGSKAFSLPTKIGKGEGALNVIEWPAYTDPSFAKPFEKQTGCKIHRKDAGSSNQMVALMRAGGGGGGGQYDLVSASGDASLRLIYGHDVVPVNVNLIPQWKNFLPVLQVAGRTTRQRHPLRHLAAVGPEHADLQHEAGEAGPDELERRSTARSTRARSASRTTRSRSPTRRCT